MNEEQLVKRIVELSEQYYLFGNSEVTDAEFDDLSSSDLLQPIAMFASAKVSGDSVYVLPTSISSINFQYLKKY